MKSVKFPTTLTLSRRFLYGSLEKFGWIGTDFAVLCASTDFRVECKATFE